MHNIQSSTTAIVFRPPYGVDATASVTFNPPTQDTLATTGQDFPANNIKLRRIKKK